MIDWSEPAEVIERKIRAFDPWPGAFSQLFDTTKKACKLKIFRATVSDRSIGEPGTIRHDWFLSDDGTRCVVREAYTSSDAFLAHLAAAGPLLGRLVELGGGLELELFGEPSAALLDAVSAFQPQIYHYTQGKSPGDRPDVIRPSAVPRLQEVVR